METGAQSVAPRSFLMSMSTYDESAVPSAPLAVDDEAFSGRIFERIRRGEVGDGRQCAPFENTWLALDRIVFGGAPGLLFYPRESHHRNECLEADLVERDMTAVGFAVRHRVREGRETIAVITEDCPGVRLRALAEAMKLSGTMPSREVVWHVVARTAALREAWRAADVRPLDTFIGFDGSLHLFPVMPASFAWEMVSFNGDTVFDPLLVDDSVAKLAELICGALPETEYPSPATIRARLARPRRVTVIPPEVRALLEGPRTTDDATSALASLVRRYFSRAHARHRRIYGELGLDLDTCGRSREARILADGSIHHDAPSWRVQGETPDLGDTIPRGLVPWFRRLWRSRRGG